MTRPLPLMTRLPPSMTNTTLPQAVQRVSGPPPAAKRAAMTAQATLLPSRRKKQTTTWLDTECSDLVRDFWAAAGGEEKYPRTLELALGFALPVAVVRIPGLHTDAARNWLRSRRRDLVLSEPSRLLHGCLFAYRGNGIIFVDASDSADEQRFSLAHEIAHFLVDYMLPRTRACSVLGEGFAEVLDGRRGPTTAERLGSLYHGFSTQPLVNLMQRSVAGGDALAVWQVEHRADKVALALLAPPEELLDRVVGRTPEDRMERAECILVHMFGLPIEPARRYAAELFQLQTRNDSWIDGLRARLQAHSAEPVDDLQPHGHSAAHSSELPSP